jgi:predicted metalloprotease with PDZ domain
MISRRISIRIVLFWIWVISAGAPIVAGANGPLRVGYTVKVADVQEQLFHVTTQVTNVNQPNLDLSFPAWVPSLYKQQSYIKNISKFEIVDAGGKRLRHWMIRPNTWRVETKGVKAVTVDFNYRADAPLSADQARIEKDLAFFTGIQLFPMIEGHASRPSTVRFAVPEGWKVMSALKETPEPMTYTAPDYDTLAEAPAQMGKFDATRFEVGGKPHFLITAPEGAMTKETATAFSEMLAKTVSAQGQVFGELPYEKYVFFCVLKSPEGLNAQSSMGYQNSTMLVIPPGERAPFRRAGLIAGHEVFHLWNGKRIRPVEFWLPDYNKIAATPLVWVMEGFATYYCRVARYRAGLDDQSTFMHGMQEMMLGYLIDENRKSFSTADASMMSVYDFETTVAFKPSAHQNGLLLAFLMDLSIRRDTAGARSLDDVMRALYRDHYQKGKGYSAEDLLKITNQVAGVDYRPFFDNYVWGVEELPFGKVLDYAGYTVRSFPIREPSLGITWFVTPEGTRVVKVMPNSVGSEAGLLPGDMLLKLDEMNVSHGMAGARDWLTPSIGKTIKIEVRRGSEIKTLDIKVDTRQRTGYRIGENLDPTPEQMKVRESWLKTAM